MFAPNPVQFGSSVSHWDTALNPDELMEPSATPFIVDTLTTEAFYEMGWQEPNTNAQLELNLVSSCLAGRGRVDLNIVNTQTASSVYQLELGNLPARETTVPFEDRGRLSIAGRLPDTYPAVVRRDGVEILNTDLTIDCSVASPSISTSEVTIVNACRDSNAASKGQVFFQLVNPTSSARTYVIEFENVPNRARSAAAFGQAIRGTVGRPDGTYDYTVRVGSNNIDTGQVTVDCN